MIALSEEDAIFCLELKFMKKLKIEYYRKLKGLTQKRLAKLVGVSPQAVSKWEQEGCYPDITLLPDIAEILEVSIDKLFE